jgi:zeaxanthin glucosyltransferase
MTTLLISPDFYSHYQPLAVIAAALRRAGDRVIIATGRAMRPLVECDGHEWRHLELAAGSNDGLASAATHDRTDDSSLGDFIEATCRGFVATLAFQATKRSRELLWNPVDVGRYIVALLDEIDADHVVVDQVSLVSTLGLLASGRPFTTLVPGHPTQLPRAGEQYGDASAWPDVLRPDRAELAALSSTVERVNSDVTSEFNRALRELTHSIDEVDDAFAVHGERVAYHWAADLHDPLRRPALPSGHVDLGPLVREEILPAEFASLTDRRRPLVLIAFGTFLVHRRDVIETVMSAVERLGARAVVAIGEHDPASFGPVPDDWVLARRIPQVALLGHTDCLVSHGGNGSVQEALAAGVGQVVLPMSTDQMAIAADLVRVGRAAAVDPNGIVVDGLAEAIAATIAAIRQEPMPSTLGDLTEALLAPAP